MSKKKSTGISLSIDQFEALERNINEAINEDIEGSITRKDIHIKLTDNGSGQVGVEIAIPYESMFWHNFEI